MARQSAHAQTPRSGAGTSASGTAFQFPSHSRAWVGVLLLLAVTLLAYQPAWTGKPIWDDNEHLTKPELSSLRGLARIWTDPRSTTQYYPLLHTTFWVEHTLWGDSTLGYHLVNILLHVTSAVLLLNLLQRLKIPGAWLAAAIFALHPVQVESVAWITELKNTLSAVLFLAALSSYLWFDDSRSGRLYGLALLLFVAALLAKTVTAILPAALLVILWWKRGRLSWQRDVVPVLPFLAIGAFGGAITAWWELAVNHSRGGLFDLAWMDRILIAGRAFWFQLSKLLWPAGLCFSYTRWPVNPSAWRPYLFPAGMAGLFLVLWQMRRWTRAPLAAVLLFAVGLFPTLGFFNLYTFRFSFVADHYQYLANPGVIALAAGGIALALRHWGLWLRAPGNLCCMALLTTLAILTWRQSRIYADPETLRHDTLKKNPDAWLAHNNWAEALTGQGEIEAAMAHYRESLRIQPLQPEGHLNLGILLAQQGKLDEARTHFNDALKSDPLYAAACYNLGVLAELRGDPAEALAQYRQALELQPNYAGARKHLAFALAQAGNLEDAIAQYRLLLRLTPDDAAVHHDLGVALMRRGHFDEAIQEFREALRAEPGNALVHSNLGHALAAQTRFAEAIEHYRAALPMMPAAPVLRYELAVALLNQGQREEALELFREALRLKPDYPEARRQLETLSPPPKR